MTVLGSLIEVTYKYKISKFRENKNLSPEAEPVQPHSTEERLLNSENLMNACLTSNYENPWKGTRIK